MQPLSPVKTVAASAAVYQASYLVHDDTVAAPARMEKGRVLVQKPKTPVLGAVPKTQISSNPHRDISYLSDRWGHNANMPPPSRQQGARPTPSLQKRRSWTTDDLPDLTPASRAEAIALAHDLRQRVAELGPEPEAGPELDALDAAFAEASRQVLVHCSERGELLEMIRSRHKCRFREYKQVLAARERELTLFREQHERFATMAAREVGEKTKTSSLLILWNRALCQGVSENATEKVTNEQQRRQAVEDSLGRDLTKALATQDQLTAELAKVSATAEVLQEKADEQPTLAKMLEQVPLLSGEEETALSFALINRQHAGDAQPLLPTLKRGEQRHCLKGLLNALPSAMRVALLSSVLKDTLSAEQRISLVTEIMRGMPPECVGEALAGIFSISAAERSGTVSGQFLLEAADRRRQICKSLVERLGELDRTAPELWAAFRPPQSQLKAALEQRERTIEHMKHALSQLRGEVQTALDMNESMKSLHTALEARYASLEAAVLADASEELTKLLASPTRHSRQQPHDAPHDTPHDAPQDKPDEMVDEVDRPAAGQRWPRASIMTSAAGAGAPTVDLAIRPHTAPLISPRRSIVSGGGMQHSPLEEDSGNRHYRAQLELEKEREASLQERAVGAYNCRRGL